MMCSTALVMVALAITVVLGQDSTETFTGVGVVCLAECLPCLHSEHISSQPPNHSFFTVKVHL